MKEKGEKVEKEEEEEEGERSESQEIEAWAGAPVSKDARFELRVRRGSSRVPASGVGFRADEGAVFVGPQGPWEAVVPTGGVGEPLT
ncbi:hypothetical protein KM043_013209 [Ampulex compressa]|nr:hypothetical protein KM043_013209 [Ampulex compressa]